MTEVAREESPEMEKNRLRRQALANYALIRLERCDERRKKIEATTSEPEPIGSDSEIEVQRKIATSQARKRRERKATTGDFYRKQAAEEKKEKMKENKYNEEMVSIFDDDSGASTELPKTQATERWREKQEERGEYFSRAATREIAATLIEKTTQLFVAAGRSKNLKSTVSGKMKDNTATIMAAITTLVRRTEEIGASEEIERLTRKLQKENEEKEKLQKEFGQLKEEFKFLREQFETNQIREHEERDSNPKQ